MWNVYTWKTENLFFKLLLPLSLKFAVYSSYKHESERINMTSTGICASDMFTLGDRKLVSSNYCCHWALLFYKHFYLIYDKLYRLLSWKTSRSGRFFFSDKFLHNHTTGMSCFFAHCFISQSKFLRKTRCAGNTESCYVYTYNIIDLISLQLLKFSETLISSRIYCGCIF